jgi:hypothetical protein
MRMKAFLAVAAAAVACGTAATANAAPGGVVYSFLGKLSSVPSGGRLSITVEGGSRPALRALLGHSAAQTFSYGDSTRFLVWSNGIPKVGTVGDLHSGDYVRVNVRAPRGASLDAIEGTAAALIGDHGTELNRPDQPDFLFRGKVTAVGSSSVTVDVAGGNRRALRLLIGQSTTQEFKVGESTIFLRWQGRVPTVISLSDLKSGDRVAVHVRAAAGSSLSQVESTAAAKVAEHEPAGSS